MTTVVALQDQAAELGTDQPRGRSELGGVPIDRVDLDGAVDRAMEAVATSAFTQICTVNLDFLVNARRDPATRAVLSHSELNLADGAPVVWLGRLLGSRLPGRVAGSDLVPRLAASAADSGAGIFFLGGEDGNATVAAERLADRFPGLVVAGVHEPARAALEEMDDDDIVRRLEESGADILLVAARASQAGQVDRPQPGSAPRLGRRRRGLHLRPDRRPAQPGPPLDAAHRPRVAVQAGPRAQPPRTPLLRRRLVPADGLHSDDRAPTPAHPPSGLTRPCCVGDPPRPDGTRRGPTLPNYWEGRRLGVATVDGPPYFAMNAAMAWYWAFGRYGALSLNISRYP